MISYNQIDIQSFNLNSIYTFYEYEFLNSFNLIENIENQVIELQEEYGVKDVGDMEISHDDSSDIYGSPSFIDNVCPLCTKVLGFDVILPYFYDNKNDVYMSAESLQKKVNDIYFKVTYLIEDAKQEVNPEYGLDDVVGAKYRTSYFHPDIDILAEIEKLQEYIYEKNIESVKEDSVAEEMEIE